MRCELSCLKYYIFHYFPALSAIAVWKSLLMQETIDNLLIFSSLSYKTFVPYA